MTCSPRRERTPTRFTVAVARELDVVQAHLGTGASVLARIVDDEWMVLGVAANDGIALQPGDVLDAGPTLCARMLAGRGPAYARDVSAVPAHATARFLVELGVGAYLGAPVRLPGGAPFGTLCALDRRPRPELTAAHLAFVVEIADRLGIEVDGEQTRLAAARTETRGRLAAECDALTGLLSRSAWEATIAFEAGQASLGDRQTVLVLDIDGLKTANERRGRDGGDRILRHVAGALRGTVGPEGVVARLGGDEFGVLLHGPTMRRADALVDALRRSLRDAGVVVRFTAGIASANGGAALPAACELAEHRLHALKAASRSGRLDHD